MSNILVTGGAGFIGSNLVDLLINRGHKVTVWDDLSTGHLASVNNYAEFECLDVSLPFSDRFIETRENYDVIYHMAALARIQPSFQHPLLTSRNNVDGIMQMLELARKMGAKFIYPGSSSFYHDVHANPYSFTKWLGEEYCKLYNKVYGVSTAIARFFNVYGPRQIDEGAYATVIGIWLKQYQNGQPLTITGTGEKRRDFTHVFDICDGLIALAENTWNADIFDFGTGVNYSMNEVAAMFKTETVYIPDRPGEAQTTLADIRLSREKLGYEPCRKLEEYIQSQS